MVDHHRGCLATGPPLMAARITSYLRDNRGDRLPVDTCAEHAGMEGVNMRALSAMIAVAALGLTLSIVHAAEKPDATIKLSGGEISTVEMNLP